VQITLSDNQGRKIVFTYTIEFLDQPTPHGEICSWECECGDVLPFDDLIFHAAIHNVED
jgi:ectoine hydroxylase-related dioxygenase (phytanoyl-CoA dioxygenase family)